MSGRIIFAAPSPFSSIFFVPLSLPFPLRFLSYFPFILLFFFRLHRFSYYVFIPLLFLSLLLFILLFLLFLLLHLYSAPVNKLVSLTSLLWAPEKFLEFYITRHYSYSSSFSYFVSSNFFCSILFLLFLLHPVLFLSPHTCKCFSQFLSEFSTASILSLPARNRLSIDSSSRSNFLFSHPSS